MLIDDCFMHAVPDFLCILHNGDMELSQKQSAILGHCLALQHGAGLPQQCSSICLWPVEIELPLQQLAALETSGQDCST